MPLRLLVASNSMLYTLALAMSMIAASVTMQSVAAR